MKKIKVFLFTLIFGLCSCVVMDQEYSPTASLLYDSYSSIMEANEISIPELREEPFTIKELEGFTNGGYITCIILSDFNHDGTKELCFGVSFGSGYINAYVTIYDYKNHNSLFTAGTRFTNDVYFILKDNTLWIKETLPMQNETIRMGKLVYSNNSIKVNYID